MLWYKGNISDSVILVGRFAYIVSDLKERVVEEIEDFLKDGVFRLTADMNEWLIYVKLHYIK